MTALGARQMAVLKGSTGRVNVSVGSIRAGKTVASVLGFLLWLSKAPNDGALVIVGRTRDAAWRNVVAVMQDPNVVGSTVAASVVGNHGAPTVKVLGRTVYVFGASDAKAESSLRGLTVHGGLVDEVTVLPEQFFAQLLGRMSPPGARLFVTTNPDSPRHWFKVQYLDRLGEGGIEGWTYFTTTIDDNPGLTDTYRAAVKSEFTGLWYRRFILGEWVAGEGSVFGMFDPERHQVRFDDLTGDLQVVRLLGVGIDHGTTNPTSAIALGLTRDGRLVLTDEWRYDPAKTRTRLTDAQLSAHVRGWLDTEHAPLHGLGHGRTIVDPAAASFRVQLQMDGQSSEPADNDVAYGIGLVASLLGSGSLLVTERCAGLLDELPAYAWDPKAAEKGEDKPLKVADHSVDAMRYAIVKTEGQWRRAVDSARYRRESL